MTPTCARMVVRWVGSPEEPDRERMPCGRPAKSWLRAEGSNVRVPVCGRHDKISARMRGIVTVHVEPIL